MLITSQGTRLYANEGLGPRPHVNHDALAPLYAKRDPEAPPRGDDVIA